MARMSNSSRATASGTTSTDTCWASGTRECGTEIARMPMGLAAVHVLEGRAPTYAASPRSTPQRAGRGTEGLACGLVDVISLE